MNRPEYVRPENHFVKVSRHYYDVVRTVGQGLSDCVIVFPGHCDLISNSSLYLLCETRLKGCLDTRPETDCRYSIV